MGPPAIPALRAGAKEFGATAVAARVVLWCGGFALLAFAALGAQFRDHEGYLTGAFCLPLSCAAALAFLGWAVVGRWRRAAFWMALSMTGQAAALQLIDAGTRIHYQHYLPDRLAAHPVLLVLLAAQAALAAAGMHNRWRPLIAWGRKHFAPWRVAVILAVFVFSSAALSRNPADYALELVFAAAIQLVNLACVVLAGATLPPGAMEPARRFLQQSRRPVALAALWVTLVAAFLSFFAYQRHPHVPDEVAYLFHARYLAAGKLTVAPPPVPEAFGMYLIEAEPGRYYATPPPGWPALLAAGVLSGIPWAVNPVLAGLSVLLAWALLRGIYSRETAGLSLLFLCTSPWYIFMAMNLMTHTATLACALAGAAAVLRCRKTGHARWALAAGAAAGFGSLIRPLDGLITAAVLGLWLVAGWRRFRAPAIAAFAAGTVLLASPVFPYNYMLTGKPTLFPLNAYLDKHYGPGRNDLGFGPNRGLDFGGLDPFPGHGLRDVIVNTGVNVFSLNIELLGWATGSLLPVALLLCCGGAMRRDWIMAAIVASIIAIFSLYWYSGGPDFGARYWYLAIIPLIALAARAVDWLASHAGEQAVAAVILLCLASAVNYLPWRAIDKYHHYLRMRPDIRELARERGFGRSLVLVRGPSHPDYSSAWIYNPLDPQAPEPVYASDENPAWRAPLLKAYADRPVWVVEGPSITGSGYRVAQGPLPARTLLAAVAAASN